MHLSVTHSVIDGKSRRVTLLKGAEDIEIFHEFDCISAWSENTLLDGHVLCVLLTAMKIGDPLIVQGALSKGMMRNLEELQHVWHCWFPEKYKKIKISPDKIIDARRGAGDGKAISAFSGGVDASFTALRHAAPSDTGYLLTDVLMVHGFDVELTKPVYFEQLIKRTRPFIESLGLRLRTIRTNSKEKQIEWSPTWNSWEFSFGLEVAACLHMYSDEFQYGLIGSSEPYDALVLPWGSSPVTDHLMSGDSFTVVHDGAGFSRTGKISEIAHNPYVRKSLKVCWAGEDQSGNCGVCEKCIRTQLNFLVLGGSVPECFPGTVDLKNILKMKIGNKAQLAELISIATYANKQGIDAPWKYALDKRISKGVSANKNTTAKELIKKALDRLGLKEPIKKAISRLRN